MIEHTSRVDGHVEKLRMAVDIREYPEAQRLELSTVSAVVQKLTYAVTPKRTDTSLETPGSCMVTPYNTGAMLMVFLLCVISTN